MTVCPLILGIYKNKTSQSLFVEHCKVSPARETFAMAGEQVGVLIELQEEKMIH